MSPPAIAILAGGASRRFGSDKLLAVVDGRALIDGVLDVARDAGASQIVAIGPRRRGHRDLVWLPDRWPGEGPLGGVLTALTLLECDVIAIPGDLVGLEVGLLTRLIGDDPAVAQPATRPERNHIGAALTRVPRQNHDVFVVSSTGDPAHHFGMARWNYQCRNALEQMFAAGIRSIHDAIARLDTGVLQGGDTIRDIDEPADIAPQSVHLPADDGSTGSPSVSARDEAT